MKSIYQKTKLSILLLMIGVGASNLFAQQDSLLIEKSKKNNKADNNRNVMLNASSANGPREISIGLPGGDVSVLENGLPVVYPTNPHSVNSHWRGDSSLESTGLMKISETAITTGNIGYAVTSFTQLGLNSEKKFNGAINYNANQYGKQQFDINVNGAIGNDWYYSGNVYQNFDPGTFKLKLDRKSVV